MDLNNYWREQGTKQVLNWVVQKIWATLLEIVSINDTLDIGIWEGTRPFTRLIYYICINLYCLSHYCSTEAPPIRRAPEIPSEENPFSKPPSQDLNGLCLYQNDSEATNPSLSICLPQSFLRLVHCRTLTILPALYLRPMPSRSNARELNIPWKQSSSFSLPPGKPYPR